MRAVYRLGIDIGVNSLGWCALLLDAKDEPCGILDLGTRIYTDGRDPKKGASLAVDRRLARQMRRRRDRFVRRRDDLMTALIEHGLMPVEATQRKALESLDPYMLRARALDHALTLHEFGRAIFHMHQRRGFSSRKTDKSATDETGKIETGISKLRDQIADAGARTLGEYLWKRQQHRQAVRVRLYGEGAKAEYEFYPERTMVAEEFDSLWAAQAGFHHELTPVMRVALRKVMFRQRPLKPILPGKCRFIPSESRAPLALPLAQRFRILQELANLAVELPNGDQKRLTRTQRDQLLTVLTEGKDLTFKRMRQLLRLDSSLRFNLEDAKRDRLKGDSVAAMMRKPGCFGQRWLRKQEGERTEIIEALLTETEESGLLARAQRDWGLDEPSTQNVLHAPLPEGYGSLGRTALARLVEIMHTAPDPKDPECCIRFHDAVPVADPRWHHSDLRTGELFDRLPYYGKVLERHVAWGTGEPTDPDEKRYGRLANPTVHIGLNQLRDFVNSMIAEYGHPRQVVVELARELKLSRDEKDRITKEQAEKGAAAEKRRTKLKELGQPINSENMLRLRLWEELSHQAHDRRCVYTGTPIGCTMLFADPPRLAIDHILPFRDSFDDSIANKILCMADANNRKRKRTPHEAFGHTSEWPDIQRRAESLPKNKRWRFTPDAIARLKLARQGDLPAEVLKDMEFGDGFLARNLIDTQYLSRLTREYLSYICDPSQVYVIPGRLTAMLRGKWGLNSVLPNSNSKNRMDHRHHPIDACVVALTTRSMLQRIAHAAEASRERLIDDMPPPWPGFRDELRAKLLRTTVSLRPDHGKGGRLHEETAYGMVVNSDDGTAREDGNLVFRKPFTALNENEIARIRDTRHRTGDPPRLRELVQAHVAAAKEAAGGKLSAVALRHTLAEFAATAPKEYRGISRVRLLKAEEDTITIRDKNGRPYKALSPGANHHIAIYEQPDGSWVPELVTMFDANQPHPPRRRNAHPAARLVMRLHKGDYLKVQPRPEDEERIMRIVRLGAKNNVLWLADHNETGELQKRHEDPDDPFRWVFLGLNLLKARRTRKVTVDILGRVRDPGPPA